MTATVNIGQRHDDVAAAATLVEMCRRRALGDSDRVGFVFLGDAGGPDTQLTFGELDRRARAVAAALAERVEPGARALLHFPSGPEFLAGFYGCLYAGVVAIPGTPIEGTAPDGPLPARCRAIVASATPAIVLSVRESLDRLTPEVMHAGGLDSMLTLATDEVDAAAAGRWRAPALDGDSLAYLQYSSGSTGVPKGVMLRHRAILHNIATIRDVCGAGRDSMGALWLPMFHDMGLVAGALMPVLAGGRMKLMSPIAFLQRPHRWLEALSERNAVTAGPDFAYDLCTRRVSDAKLQGLDLSGLGCAIVGAERVRAATLARFADRFGPRGFRRESFAPCYGLAETTLLVTGGPVGRVPTVRRLDVAALSRDEVVEADDEGEAISLVACGRPRPGLDVVVADPEALRPVPPGRVGEICVAGESLGSGYFNAPEQTARSFGVTLAGRTGAFLRTGDLGALVDGELFISGRRKELIIVDGRNHYPPDLEATAQAAHPAIRRGFCVVVSVDDGRRERVVVLAELLGRAIHEARRSPAGGEVEGDVTSAVRRALSAGHGVSVDDVLLLRPGTLPLTTSGKLQRVACRTRYAADSFESSRAVLSGSALEEAA